jgi:hypothetical protein
LGTAILLKEEELGNIFKKKADSDKLKALVMEITRLRAELRLVHLLAHLEMKGVLSQEQIEKYDQLRGYETNGRSDKHHHHESR